MGKDRAGKKRKKERRRPRRALGAAAPAVERVDEAELLALVERAREGSLSDEECTRLRAAVETLSFVIRELGEKNLSLRRLRSLL